MWILLMDIYSIPPYHHYQMFCFTTSHFATWESLFGKLGTAPQYQIVYVADFSKGLLKNCVYKRLSQQMRQNSA